MDEAKHGGDAGSGSADPPSEGKRMAKFREVLMTALQYSQKHIDERQHQRAILKCFKAADGRLLVDKATVLGHAGVIGSRVTQSVKEDFEKVCQARQVAAKLNRLDDTLASQELVNDVNLPAGSVVPADVLRQHSMRLKLEEEAALQAILRQKEAENAALAKHVADLTAQAQEMAGVIQALAETVTSAANAADDFVDAVEGS